MMAVVGSGRKAEFFFGSSGSSFSALGVSGWGVWRRASLGSRRRSKEGHSRGMQSERIRKFLKRRKK
jgi:hypothetical protein